MTAKKTNDLAFSLETELLPGFERGEASLHFTAQILRVTDDGLRNILWDRYGDDQGVQDLADLAVTGYANTDWEHIYGWHTAYSQPHSVELDQARAMVRVLGRIERRLEASSNPPGTRYDPPRSFTDYLLRVAKILGVKQFVVYGKRRPNGTRPWRVLDTSAAVAWLDERLAEFREQYPVKQQEVTT